MGGESCSCPWNLSNCEVDQELAYVFHLSSYKVMIWVQDGLITIPTTLIIIYCIVGLVMSVFKNLRRETSTISLNLRRDRYYTLIIRQVLPSVWIRWGWTPTDFWECSALEITFPPMRASLDFHSPCKEVSVLSYIQYCGHPLILPQSSTDGFPKEWQQQWAVTKTSANVGKECADVFTDGTAHETFQQPQWGVIKIFSTVGGPISTDAWDKSYGQW